MPVEHRKEKVSYQSKGKEDVLEGEKIIYKGLNKGRKENS